MLHFTAIKIKAFFLLTVFTANLYAVCHCRHDMSTPASFPSGLAAMRAMGTDQGGMQPLSAIDKGGAHEEGMACHGGHCGMSHEMKKDQASACQDSKNGPKHEPLDNPKNGPKSDPGCPAKGGCCGQHAVQFSLLDKQVSGRVAAVTPVLIEAITVNVPFYIEQPRLLPGQAVIVRDEWLHKHSPPDLQSLYQSFLI